LVLISWASVDIQSTLESSTSNKSKHASEITGQLREMCSCNMLSSKSGLVGGGIKEMDRDHTDFTK